MKWEMEIDEIEAVLEKIWDLHDKLSDAIHSISRTHFLNSIQTHRNSDTKKPSAASPNDALPGHRGFVFVKDFRFHHDDDSAIREAKSLNAIRTALENLEEQLEILHTVQAQQRVERDAALAQLEQSRIVLAMRLAEHHGKKYKVIEEALAFVGDVQEANQFVSPEKHYGSPFSPSGEKLESHERKRSNLLYNFFISSFNLVKKTLKLECFGGILGNTALVAISMIALLQMQQVAHREDNQKHEDIVHRRVRKASRLQASPSHDSLSNLDVLLARG
ncbi:plastid division protein PDV1 isoform X2 [Cannabis sativa]|uniref:plastid division protein PDV1 isoform X2 n=1 Tax=Cannabis sativa TaxID=3483 RepID=UPI0029CA4CC6|nr:plastid division protein PDV1 isoform X2 [Cannabis sativa]